MDVGAGDQGNMFGCASDETEERIALTHSVVTEAGKHVALMLWACPATADAAALTAERAAGIWA